MGKFTITSEEKAELKTADSTTPMALPGSDGQSKGIYHNPATGREITSLADAYHIMLRLRQGWRLGPASPELKEKWKVREAELRAEDDAYVKQHVASQEHVESETTRFNDAVQSAVTQVLEKLESYTAPTELPDRAGVEVEAAPPAVNPAPPEQSDFFQAVDAPTESETKLTVSQASQPDLHLVGLGEE